MPKQAKEYSERITFRVSPKLIEAIEAERAISGQSRTQLIREVLRSHFNI
jgi:predicted HicB family RNase H-like nuclease